MVRESADFIRVAAPGDNLHESFKERGLGRREIGEKVGGRADARVCPGVPLHMFL